MPVEPWKSSRWTWQTSPTGTLAADAVVVTVVASAAARSEAATSFMGTSCGDGLTAAEVGSPATAPSLGPLSPGRGTGRDRASGVPGRDGRPEQATQAFFGGFGGAGPHCVGGNAITAPPAFGRSARAWAAAPRPSGRGQVTAGKIGT